MANPSHDQAPGETLRAKLLTFCVECGPSVRVDEDGCCVACGNGALPSEAAIDGLLALLPPASAGAEPTRAALVAQLRELLAEEWHAHSDPNEAGYNQCDTGECAWCEDTKRIMAALAQPAVSSEAQPGTWRSIERLEQWSAETQGSWRLTRVTNKAHALAPFGVGFGVELMTAEGVRAFEKSGHDRPLDVAVSAAFVRVGYEPRSSSATGTGKDTTT